ncbi:MAG: fibronectin type III domain-containing protein, partial [Planctomycetia bacterium]|nr:fibronectin type III domain-containing protein [Planctomycetia bacterium]
MWSPNSELQPFDGYDGAAIGFRLASIAQPGIPSAVVGMAGNAQVSLAWTAPSTTGGAAITDYVVEYKTTAAAVWTTFNDGVSSLTTATVTGLSNGTSYLFRVSAKNVAGTGAASEQVSATPATVPGAPLGVIVTADRARALVTWSAPSFDGGSPITGYLVEWFVNGSLTSSSSVGASARSLQVPMLVEGWNYSFRVSAHNAMGQGSASAEASVTAPRESGFPVRGGGTVAETVGGVATVSGATLVTGSFSGTATFGGTTLTSAGGTDIYVAKLNADGSYAWAVRAGGTDDDYAEKVTALGDGSLLVTGSFSGTAAFGGTSLVSGGYDAFVAKLGANGSFAWVRSLGNTGNSRGAAVAALSDGTAV